MFNHSGMCVKFGLRFIVVWRLEIISQVRRENKRKEKMLERERK